MPSKKNTERLQEIKEKLDKSTALFFVNYQGLTHTQLEEARKILKEANSELAVVKNTLVNLALKQRAIDAKERLYGPVAALFSYSDPLITAKALYTFFKKYNLPKIKFGVFEGKVIEDKEVEKLATLPSQEILMGRLVGLLASPIQALLYSLSWNMQKLVLVLKEIERKKS